MTRENGLARFVAPGIAVLAAINLGTALWIFAAPHGFAHALAPFGPYNRHDLWDAAAFTGGLGLALAASLAWPALRAGALAAAAGMTTLHAIESLDRRVARTAGFARRGRRRGVAHGERRVRGLPGLRRDAGAARGGRSAHAGVSLAFTAAHRGGSGPPLVCLHGFMDTWRAWELVLPALERHHDVLAPTLAGHAGGPPLGGGRLDTAILDAVERAMDDAGWETAHVVGSSMGGFAALELAARGRARSVVALAPAGGWQPEDEFLAELLAAQERMHAQARAFAPHARVSRDGRRAAPRDRAPDGRVRAHPGGAHRAPDPRHRAV